MKLGTNKNNSSNKDDTAITRILCNPTVVYDPTNHMITNTGIITDFTTLSEQQRKYLFKVYKWTLGTRQYNQKIFKYTSKQGNWNIDVYMIEKILDNGYYTKIEGKYINSLKPLTKTLKL